MKFEIIDTGIKKPTGADYPYVEHHLSHEDSVYGFSLLVKAQAVLAAPVTVNVIAGFDSDVIVPATEIAGDTFYSVNGAAGASRYLGDLTFDFSTLTTNILDIEPGMTLGGVTFPDPLPPIIGFRFASADLRLVKSRCTFRLGN